MPKQEKEPRVKGKIKTQVISGNRYFGCPEDTVRS